MKRNQIVTCLFFLSCLIVLNGCKFTPIDESDCGKEITKNVVFKDKGDGVDYVLNCMLVVSDCKLKIEPGVHIQFEGEQSGIYVKDDGELDIVGTSSKRIILEGKNPVKGSWSGIVIGSDKDNEIVYTDILNAGGFQHQWMYEKAAVGLGYKDQNPKLRLSNCNIRLSGGHGLYLSASSSNLVRFNDNLFEENDGYPIYIPFSEIGSLDNGTVYNNPSKPNTQEAIAIYGEDKGGNFSDLTYSEKISDTGIPYRVMNPCIVDGGHLTFEPGVIMEFMPDAFLAVVGEDSASSIEAIGTENNPVTFTKATSDLQSGWSGLYFANTAPRNHLRNCVIEFGGKTNPYGSLGTGNVVIGGDYSRGQVEIENCIIRNSAAYGIHKRFDALFSGSGNYFGGNASGDVGNF
ncbi:MAG: right-handed parallel beta-helix repeat-containing protein [Bacteroidia bacterium]|nr:right-handed parallel beta-helix repeat-containing protein [Bacteroidia bacterium]